MPGKQQERYDGGGVKRAYGRHFTVEETFRDLKDPHLDWNSSRRRPRKMTGKTCSPYSQPSFTRCARSESTPARTLAWSAGLEPRVRERSPSSVRDSPLKGCCPPCAKIVCNRS